MKGNTLFYLLLAVFLAGFFIGATTVAHGIKKIAIERGFAEYDSKTGEWQWKESK